MVLPELTISVNTSTVAQGGAASFIITASQPVVKATSVNFTVQGTAQPGQDYQPLVGAALLQAGQSQVTVVLQSLRTDVSFEPTDMIVGQWPTDVGQVFVKAGAPATPGEAILSLTEPDLTVSLQASAANRTLLKVGQSCTVQISGALTTAQGTITELDTTPTNIASGTPGGSSSQVYEGRIEVSGLSGADGSAGFDHRRRSGSAGCSHRPHRRRQAERRGERHRPGDRPQDRQGHRGAGDDRSHRRVLHPGEERCAGR